ncbi:MAG: TRAP transporter substrate-binding protein DctP [Hyphomicrobiales bacterium]|nr:TRAP transporter substrate-binding protein DctP [Hyphomicrobiales bacterium]
MKNLWVSAALVTAMAVPASAAEVRIKAYSSMAKNLLYTKVFLDEFVKPANAAGKGMFKIAFIGGPEVTPARKSAQALKRGVFDIVYGPAGYYAGDVPEGLALHGRTASTDVLRKNGAYELLTRIWSERVGARFLGWGISNLSYNLFFTTEPKVTDGKLDLTGMKMRASPTYKPRVESLGGIPVRVPAPEMYTALKSGIVKGTGWPEIGIAATGVGKLMKYKVEPSFYATNHIIIFNEKTWAKLPKKAQDILTRAAVEYEKKSVEIMKKVRDEENAKLAKFGIKTIRLTGKGAEHFTRSGNDALWETVSKRSKYAAQLRALLEPKAN